MILCVLCFQRQSFLTFNTFKWICTCLGVLVEDKCQALTIKTQIRTTADILIVLVCLLLLLFVLIFFFQKLKKNEIGLPFHEIIMIMMIIECRLLQFRLATEYFLNTFFFFSKNEVWHFTFQTIHMICQVLFSLENINNKKRIEYRLLEFCWALWFIYSGPSCSKRR